jgi:acyl-CoA dehydrogenase
MVCALLLAAAVVFVALLYMGRGYWAWVAATPLALVAWAESGVGGLGLFQGVAVAAAVAALLFGIPVLRRPVVSAPAMRAVGATLPRMGDTERIALEAGTVWWDRDLFSGNPNWRSLLEFKKPALSAREQVFLDGPVEELCAMVDDWQIAQDRDLPPEVWAFLKKHKFFGMIIPEAYGGLGFTALGHSAVVVKISSRSVPTAVTVMVPNSLGPAELLLHYGTDEQKNYYLPRLATGEEIPCFALTGPEAGSDAAATESTGVVCRGTYEGKDVLGMRLNFRKRYITLAPVATVVGLAFKLFDPDHLLGDKEELGITCALLPRNLTGMEIGRRHDPMGVPFQNGPIVGKDVFVPIDFIIGGRAGVGQGWRMLMECLAAGRSISLPALSVGAVEISARLAGAYGSVREQFNTPIGRFEGIEEALARIGGYAYFMNAARVLTCGAVDAGEKPGVLSAIVKAYLTEGMRLTLNDAMDIQAGAAICRGPRNVLGRGYIGVPIAITVEGANILTRSLIIYGQGAIRCHPFVREEMESVAARDVARFDRAFFGHVNFVFQNAVRSLALALTGGALASAPVGGWTAGYFKKLTRFSAAFALISDAAMATMGGQLKRREKISGRFADALAWMYLASAALKRYHDDGGPASDRDVLRWSLDLALWRTQEALRELLDNFPNRVVAGVLCVLTFPLGGRLRPPSDDLGTKVAASLLEDGEVRRRLTVDIFVPKIDAPGLGKIEAALRTIMLARPADKKLRAAERAGKIDANTRERLLKDAVAAGVITADERRLLEEADRARDDAVQVDAYAPDVYDNVKG